MGVEEGRRRGVWRRRREVERDAICAADGLTLSMEIEKHNGFQSQAQSQPRGRAMVRWRCQRKREVE